MSMLYSSICQNGNNLRRSFMGVTHALLHNEEPLILVMNQKMRL